MPDEYSPPPYLLTERLILRPFVEEDWQAFLAFQQNPAIYRWEFMKYPSEEAHREIFDVYVQVGQLNQIHSLGICYAVVTREEQKVIGSISCSYRDGKRREKHFGFHIGELYWNRGYGTEAGRALLDFMFSEGMPRVEARCFEGNIGSVRAMTKIGLRQTPLTWWQHIEQRLRPPGRLKLQFSLTAEQWREKRGKDV